MDIENIKNELKDHVLDSVKDEAKDATMVWIKDKILPAVKDIAEAYTAALKESAANESGWNKFRDTVFLPMLVDGAFWVFDKALAKMLTGQTVKDLA